MARLTHGGENIGSREFLIEYAETVLIPVMNSSKTFMASATQLKTGGEYQLHRYELPDAHPVGTLVSSTTGLCLAPTTCCGEVSL
jgi:hypothetical protein